MNRFALILALSLVGCFSLAHKGIDIEGSAGVTADRSRLRLNGVVSQLYPHGTDLIASR